MSARNPVAPAPQRLVDVNAIKWRSGANVAARDSLAIEEPLEIRLAGRRFTLTMRTPGHDEELVVGFLLAEGFVNAPGELDEIRKVRGARGAPEPNAVDVILKVPSAQLRDRLKRNFVISSSCGVCGKTCVEAISRRLARITSPLRVSASLLRAMAPEMLAEQEVFAATGGLHAAALFDFNGKLRVAREDIGRHNAVDKVAGYALLHEMVPLGDSILMVSGRLSFEIVQKAAAAGIPILAGISAPSSLAVELSDQLGITLIGFLRDSGFNIYCHPDRVGA